MTENIDEYIDEYAKISKILNNVSEKINKYKESINQKIDECKNEEDKKHHIDEYNNFISLIQNDSDITRKFIYLRSRQEELKNIIQELDPDNKSSIHKKCINKTLDDLKTKYSL